MAQRQDLQTLLETLMGHNRVYFQAPTNVLLEYPCVIYQVDDIHTDHADNLPYRHKIRYQITVIFSDPDDFSHLKVGSLPSAKFDRQFKVDGLYHFVYSIHF